MASFSFVVSVGGLVLAGAAVAGLEVVTASFAFDWLDVSPPWLGEGNGESSQNPESSLIS